MWNTAQDLKLLDAVHKNPVYPTNKITFLGIKKKKQQQILRFSSALVTLSLFKCQLVKRCRVCKQMSIPVAFFCSIFSIAAHVSMKRHHKDDCVGTFLRTRPFVRS